ncbi:type II secretion system minor pseudopilin GspK [Rhodoferax sp.]|uniref:type II secretion system minor pseudopilin GspK n=1 Tax=Rhodoferax sp. TaxID=50421 RepID=UPI00274D844C|nr:type II secretion system minor pseudopilin GspK [Rhodoferax sp.]
MSAAQTAQRGAAILLAMLTVTLVATVAAAALWQQWRSLEVETAERARIQAAWVLTGALDWSRLVLREDSRAGGAADHLAEPWAVPLEEARLSTFLAADRDNQANVDELGEDAFLSGHITDLQSRLNVANLINNGQVEPIVRRQFTKLFTLLDLPQTELDRLAENLRVASDFSPDNKSADAAPLRPQRVEELVWLGLSPRSLAALAPYVTVLPTRTPVNINTASAEVLYASFETVDLIGAKRLVAARERSHFRTLADVNAADGGVKGEPSAELFSVTTRFFEVRGQLRIGQTTVIERSLVQRDAFPTTSSTRVVWRERVPAHSLQ